MRVALVVLLLSLSLPLHAKFAGVPTEEIPVTRVIENLERTLKSAPQDEGAQLSLARAHALAYARGLVPVAVTTGTPDKTDLWFGHVPRGVPIDRPPTRVEDRARLEHLGKAVSLFASVVKQRPRDALAQLGHGWVLQESARLDEAKAAYRRALDSAFEKERGAEHRFAASIALEAASYLQPLLDPTKDAAELAAIADKVKAIEKIPRMMTPLLVPLGDDEALTDLVDEATGVAFDLDGSGVRSWSWPRPNAGWLVWDPSHTGHITSGLQLFGDATFWLFFADGFDALCSLDDDGDGTIDGNERASLAVWRDADTNGVSDPGELLTLDGLGIRSLACTGARASGRHFVRDRGVVHEDGTTRPLWDYVARSLGPNGSGVNEAHLTR